ncbi:MAG: galactosyldiacylglycerol synthase [Deltaproteobacteria bacterium]|nr:MAG: galactosyldiacylglycerol synthase [Deltaproteobacteria bacterium]
MSKKHILVLSVSAGAGHVRAAQALCAAAERGFRQLRLTHVDVMDLVPAGFRKLYADSYIKLVEKMPLAWAYLYQYTDQRSAKSLFDRLRRNIERLNTRKLNRELKRLAPDAIICTHFLPAELLSRRLARGRPTPPVWVQVTDFDVHGLWIHPHMQGYFAANDEVAWRIAARGIAPKQTFITGIPIMPQFSAAPARADCALEIGLDPRKTTLLIMSGGVGIGGIEALAERLASLQHDLQVIALAGRNEALLGKLQGIARRYPARLLPMGFTRTIERVMAAADIAITKPGGLTTSECLAMGLPMIVISPIPGQEERNADFLLESGAALKAIDAAALEYKLRLLLEQPQRLAAMRERMRAHAKPNAVANVLDLVSGRL